MITKYNITGMSCAACQARVEKAVSKVDGVRNCAVSLLTNSMRVEGNVESSAIIKAVKDAGYGANIIDDIDNEDLLIDKESPRIFKRLILSILFLLILMYFSMGHMLFAFPMPKCFEDNDFYSGLLQMIIAFIVMYINKKFFISGIKGVVHLSPNMDTLVSLGSGTSFIWSIYNLFTGTSELYFESSAMILTLITVGKFLEAKSKGRTTDALKSLVKLMPKEAIIVRDGKENKLPIEEIEKGDIFIVHSGTTIPVDGIILEGDTSINESALTGESELVKKKAGDHVSSGTINQIGQIICKATRVGEDTTLSQIIKLVSDAASTKAPIAKVADRVSGVFVPCVICIALLTFIVWILSKQTIDFALARAISVLVISCPCALGLATPVAIMVGSGLGAKHGILFKTAVSLEETGKAQLVALDKTGTVTKGIPVELIVNKVEGATAFDDVREESALSVKELKNIGLEVVMLTGDKEEVALRISKKANIDNVIYGLSPSGKADVVGRLKRIGKVIMVGDGINDAVALTSANIGMAIGAGTDVAIDAADVVLMNSKISDVGAAIRLSRQVLRIIYQNLFWAFFYNVIGIPLAAGCFINLWGLKLTPMFGAAAMSLSSIFVVTNALRLNLYDIYKDDDHKCKTIVKSDLFKIMDTYNHVMEEKTMTKTLEVKGMMCEHCEAHVRKALETIDGVKSAIASHKKGTVIVELLKDVDDKILKKVVEEEGYKVTAIA